MRKIVMYQSEEGQVFDNPKDAAEKDGWVTCFKCKGSGTETYEYREPYPDGLPDSGWVENPIQLLTRECSRCKGLKYVKHNKEEDPDFIKYQELKQKFENKVDNGN